MTLPEGLLAIDQALALLPSAMDTPAARVMLVSIAMQESGMTERRQLVGSPPRPVGPAAGLWQFELQGGCAAVLRHNASRFWMHSACSARGVEPKPRALWEALQRDDVLAAAAARLLLFTDPRRLPQIGDQDGAWQLYTRVWRPGKPHPDRWPGAYRVAMSSVAMAA